MSLQSEQIVRDETGTINASLTLRNIINTLFAMSGRGLMRATEVGFFKEESGLVFKIKLRHVASMETLDDFFAWLNINKNQVASTRIVGMKTELCFSNADDIIKIFMKTDYLMLLNDNSVCLADQVDLFQMLLADTVSKIIVDSHAFANPPEMVEFDINGNLSAVVIFPNNVRYKLENTSEVCSFLKQYCQFERHGCFVELLCQQKVGNLAAMPESIEDDSLIDIMISELYDETPGGWDAQTLSAATVPVQQTILSVRAQDDSDRMMGVLTQGLIGLGLFDSRQSSTSSSRPGDDESSRMKKIRRH